MEVVEEMIDDIEIESELDTIDGYLDALYDDDILEEEEEVIEVIDELIDDETIDDELDDIISFMDILMLNSMLISSWHQLTLTH